MVTELKFEMGARIKDKVTGFEGYVTGIYFRHGGGVRYWVQLCAGKTMAETWLDEDRAEVVPAAG